MWLPAGLIVLAFISLYPIIYAVINSLKTEPQSTVNPFWFTNWPLQWSNFLIAFETIWHAFFTSAIITSVSVVGIIALASLSGYAFARIPFPAKNVLFMIIFGLLLVPGFLTLIPLFIEIKDFGLLDHDLGLILPYIAGGQAFAIFVFRSFFSGLPDEIFESAVMDGASDLTLYGRIVMPLSIPIMVTIAIINVVGIWGDYVLPSLVMNATGHRTLAVAIVSFEAPKFAPSLNVYNIELAAYLLASIPLLFLFSFLMKYFIQGMTSGSIKM